MRCHPSALAGAVLAVALLPGVATGQRGSSAPPAFATEVLRSDSITPMFAKASPDGRWIVFSGVVRQQSSLWIMPAGGGAPRRLTSAVGDVWGPVWFPSSDRIAYVSSPSGSVMTQGIDRETGMATEAPGRVTLDRVSMLDVSPDGSLIAYTTGQGSDGKAYLKVMPARGGPARVVFDAPRFHREPRFAPDGQSLYITVFSLDRKPSQLFRVPVRGGAATVVAEETWSSRPMKWGSGNVVIHHGRDHFTAVSLTGDTLWSIPRPTSISSAELSVQGKAMLVLTSATGAGIRLHPLNGGTPHDVTTGESYDYPVGWSADGQRVFIQSGDGNTKGLWSVSVDGKEREFIPFLADSAWSGIPSRILGDGRVWMSPTLNSPSLSVYDTKTRSLRTVALSANLKEIGGPGGFWTGVRELYYLDRKANGIELRSLGEDGQLRTVRRLSFDVPIDAKVAFANHRIAYWVTAGDSAVLYVADAARAPKRVYAFEGRVMEWALSFDGSALAAATKRGPARTPARNYVTMLRITSAADLAGAPRTFQHGSVWDLTWQRDNRSVLAVENVDDGFRTRLVRISLDAARPENLTAGETMTFWDQYPSPDDKWTALPIEKPRGGTIWRVDLEAAAKAWQARARK